MKNHLKYINKILKDRDVVKLSNNDRNVVKLSNTKSSSNSPTQSTKYTIPQHRIPPHSYPPSHPTHKPTQAYTPPTRSKRGPRVQESLNIINTRGESGTNYFQYKDNGHIYRGLPVKNSIELGKVKLFPDYGSKINIINEKYYEEHKAVLGDKIRKPLKATVLGTNKSKYVILEYYIFIRFIDIYGNITKQRFYIGNIKYNLLISHYLMAKLGLSIIDKEIQKEIFAYAEDDSDVYAKDSYFWSRLAPPNQSDGDIYWIDYERGRKQGVPVFINREYLVGREIKAGNDNKYNTFTNESYHNYLTSIERIYNEEKALDGTIEALHEAEALDGALDEVKSNDTLDGALDSISLDTLDNNNIQEYIREEKYNTETDISEDDSKDSILEDEQIYNVDIGDEITEELTLEESRKRKRKLLHKLVTNTKGKISIKKTYDRIIRFRWFIIRKSK